MERANLVIRPGKIGDTVVCTPSFRAIKETFPDQPLHLLGEQGFSDLVAHDPHLDKIISVPWPASPTGDFAAWWQIFCQLRRTARYERAFILCFSNEVLNWVLFCLHISKVVQTGGTWSALLLRQPCVLRRNFCPTGHIAEYFLSVTERLGVRTDDSIPRLYVLPEEVEAIHRKFPSLQEPGKIFIHAFGITTNANLTPEGYYKLAVYLAENTPYRIYLLGTEAEAKKAALPAHPRISLELTKGLSLRELMSACTQADAVIGGSSGVSHMAAALGIPAVGLHCPRANQHLFWAPRGPWGKELHSPLELCRRLGAKEGPCGAPGFCDLSFGFSHEQIRQTVEDLIASKRMHDAATARHEQNERD